MLTFMFDIRLYISDYVGVKVLIKQVFFFNTASKPNYMNIKILLYLTHDAFLCSEDLATMLEANNTLKSETIIRMLI